MKLQGRARILLLAMLWQVLACLMPSHIDTQQALVDQLIVHAQQVGDHHHGDPSLQPDDGVNEAPHEHTNPGVQPQALAPATLWAPAMDTPAVPVARVVTGHAPVFPERPLRPPQPVTPTA